MTSVSVHAAAILLLAAGRLPGTEPLHELLWATATETVEPLEASDVSFEPALLDAPDVAHDLPADLLGPDAEPLGDLSAEAALTVAAPEGLEPSGGPAGDWGALFGEDGPGLTTFKPVLDDAPSPEFFGRRIEGRRIVFVLDNSGSMQGGRLETVIAELLACVDSLEPDQQFYVLFHSDMVYPLFYPDPVDRYIRPTDANKRMLAKWLDTVELCLGDSVEEAIALSAMIEPDTVFLLSDGRIQSEKKLRFLLAGETRNFPIHTFAVGMGSSVAGRRNLADIAAANGGEFSETEIPSEMKELARRRLRPYHSEAPGPVWGRQVKPFGPRG